MNPSWQILTGRLRLSPVGWSDMADLVALKGDPRAYAVMLGGVRAEPAVALELAAEVQAWSECGYGMWSIREIASGQFAGIVGLQTREDGRGVALRFALMPAVQGMGYASEAAGAALRFGHDRAGLPRIIAVAREDNFASRTVLGVIGMTLCDSFVRDGTVLLVFESLRNRLEDGDVMQ